MVAYKEDNLQKAAARYFDYLGILWCHVANERKASPQRGANLKKKGVKPGVPDCFIFEPRGPHPGLVIEIKVKPNKVSKDQSKWLNALEKRGWCVAVCYNFDQVQRTIDDYLKMPSTL